LEAIFGVFIAIEAVAMFINFVQADIPAKDVVIGTFVPYVSCMVSVTDTGSRSGCNSM
jgi:hypothetical protein